MNTTRILMVDDDQLIKKIYADRLQAAGYVIDTASSFTEAQSKLSKGEPFNAILLDYVLANATAIDFLTWLRKEREDTTPVIVFSALNQDENRNAAKEAGANQYLVKDQVSPSALVEELKNLLAV